MTDDSAAAASNGQASAQGVRATTSIRTVAPNGRRGDSSVKRVRAMEMRAAGYSYREIANELGFRSVSSAFETVERGLAEWAREPLDRVIALELVRLDQLVRAYWARAASGDLEAAAFVLKVLERRAKMLGLDSPKRIDVRALVAEWAESEGLSADDVLDVAVRFLN